MSIRVAAKACCPVYVIPPSTTGGRRGGPGGGRRRRLAARRRGAQGRARRGGLSGQLLRVVVAYHVPWLARPIEPKLIAEFQPSETALAAAIVDQALARVRTEADATVKIDVVLKECQPAEALISAGKEAMLTVVGSRGRCAISRALLGSVSRAVLQEATRPVAVVHFPPKKR